MTAVYSTRLLSKSGVAGLEILGPFDGFVCVIRDVDVYASTVAGTNVTIYAEDTAAAFVFFSFGAGAQGTQLWRGRQVLPNGVAAIINVSDDPADVTISGYLLTAP